MMATDSAQAVLTGLLAVVALNKQATLWELLPIAALIGAANGMFMPGAFAIVPSLLPDEALQAGSAVLNGSSQVAGLVGPALGGAVVVLVGPATAFGVDGVSFVVSVISLAAIGARQPAPATPAPRDSRTTPPSSAERPKVPRAWQLVRHERLLQVLLVVVLVANLGSGGLVGVAFPALARSSFHLGADGYGGLLACSAAGGVVGVLAAVHFGPGRRPAIRACWLSLVANASLSLAPYLGGPAHRGRRPLNLGGRKYSGKSPPDHPDPEMGTSCFPWAGHEPGPPSQRRCLPPLSRSRRVPGAGVRPRALFPLAAIFTTVAVLGALSQPQFRDLGRVPSRRRSAT